MISEIPNSPEQLLQEKKHIQFQLQLITQKVANANADSQAKFQDLIHRLQQRQTHIENLIHRARQEGNRGEW